MTAVPTKRKWGKRIRFCVMGYLVTRKVPSFKLRCCLAQWKRPLQFRWSISFVNEKSLVPVWRSRFVLDTRCVFFTFGYVIFVSNLLHNVWEESYRERYVGNSTRRLNPYDNLATFCKKDWVDDVLWRMTTMIWKERRQRIKWTKKTKKQ